VQLSIPLTNSLLLAILAYADGSLVITGLYSRRNTADLVPELLLLFDGGSTMKREATLGLTVLVLFALRSVGQTSDQRSETSRIYRVTVIERSLKAINYEYRSLPTNVDFRGTVLMPMVKGGAVVESKRGRTEIDAKLGNMEPPQRFGREYLTYVLWAITPEGRPHNIGEIVPDGSNRAKLRVTTDLQAFGLMVTAEPYSAVRRPSDVVVAENEVRSDTMGKIEQVEAKYELMPRGQYTWQPPSNLATTVPNSPKVSMDKYEATLQLYQAQNAIGIARVAGAEQYAPNTLLKAQQLLNEAQRLENSHQTRGSFVQVFADIVFEQPQLDGAVGFGNTD